MTLICIIVIIIDHGWEGIATFESYYALYYCIIVFIMKINAHFEMWT